MMMLKKISAIRREAKQTVTIEAADFCQFFSPARKLVLNEDEKFWRENSASTEAGFFLTRVGTNFAPRREQSQIPHWRRRQLLPLAQKSV
jgi:hypothetical protein